MKVRLVARAVLASLALASVSLASAGLASLALASRAQAQRGSASDISGASVTSSTVVRGAYVPGGRLEPIPVGATQYDPAALARIRNAATALDNQVNARALTGLDGATLSAEAQLLVLGVLKSATTGAGLSVNALRAILARGVPGQAILANLNIDSKATMGFAMTLSEACQNIIEHAGTGGWVGVQTYRWKQRLGRRVVVIAVCDAGQGFRRSLESAQGRRLNDRWDDAMALEEAVVRGVSRYRDPGRGQGLAGIRRYVGRWDGKLSVRSGTARISILPSWDTEDVPLNENLPDFPGAQMHITIPEGLTR